MTEPRPNDPDQQLVVRPDSTGSNLPSVDFRELIPPEAEEEIHLRDYLDVLIRRKWVVIIVLLVTFSSTALFTLTRTPLFDGKGVLKTSAREGRLTNFEDIQSSALKSMEFQQTQVRLLESEQLAIRLIDKLDLRYNPLFNQEVAAELGEEKKVSFGDLIRQTLSSVRNFIRFSPDEAESSLNKEGKDRLLVDGFVNMLRGNTRISPVRNSELIEITYESPDAQLAAQVVNTAMDEFINMHLDSNIASSRTAAKFLEKQIKTAQIKLEKSEKQLNDFSRKAGLVSMDPRLNLVMRQLEELNDALAKARAERIGKEALYQQAIGENNQNLAQILQDDLIKKLKGQYATLQSEYQDLSTTFKPAYPKMQQLRAKMEDIERRIVEEKQRIIESIKNDYEAALKKQEYLQVKAEEQKKRAIDLNDKATQYKILLREVETNKSIYQSLLQRSKEVDASLGAAVTNIQIIDRARIPLYPAKPKVSRNLLLGLLLGLFGGVGMAFLLEYLDDTIKNPDELINRFHIPVLGLVPYDKESEDDRKAMALKYYNEPRSPIAESIKTAITSIELSAAEQPPRTILITSVLAGAGKSTLSCNTALSFLSSGDKCLIIDVDLRKPSLHKIFNADNRSKGLSNVLSGMNTLKEVIRTTEFEGLDFIASGPLPPNPAELIASSRMRQLLELAGKQYSHIILDGPPYQGFAEILVLANMVDGVILVTVEGDTPRDGVKHFRRSVLNVGGSILGAIVNKAGRYKGYGSYSKYSYYAYSYNYEYGDKPLDG